MVTAIGHYALPPHHCHRAAGKIEMTLDQRIMQMEMGAGQSLTTTSSPPSLMSRARGHEMERNGFSAFSVALLKGFVCKHRLIKRKMSKAGHQRSGRLAKCVSDWWKRTAALLVLNICIPDGDGNNHSSTSRWQGAIKSFSCNVIHNYIILTFVVWIQIACVADYFKRILHWKARIIK